MPNTKVLARNAKLFDQWSIVHAGTGVLFSLFLSPLIALLPMVAWEPFEVLILSPWLMRRGIVFGYEALPNSLSDIVFDILGVVAGQLILRTLGVQPLFFT